MGNDLSIFIFQALMIIALIVVIIYMLRQNTAIKFERRIGKYSIESINNKEDSLSDIFIIDYYKFIKRMRKPMNSLFPTMSKRYEKYISYKDKDNIKSIDAITNKFLIAIAFVLLMTLSYTIRSKEVPLLQVALSFVFGFYVLDVFYIIKENQRRKKIENEMLRAIIIMNNAFKSGKSILQAVEIASNELPEPINDEFRKIYHDLKYGMSVDKSFERFAKRVNIEEANYISSSLTILNKTGGNIIKVFSSIERTLFDKKKLNDELKNLTASSNMVVKVLLFIPFIFVGIIYLLSPTYFNPFFESTLGCICLIIIFLIFVMYVWFLEKIMKVKV